MIDRKYAKRQFEIAKVYANYWQTMAVTGAYKQRQMFKTDGGVEQSLTDEEKLMDTMSISLKHIHRMIELAEKLYKDPSSKT